MRIETKADASVTEELIALTKADRIKRKVLEWERSGRDEGPDMRQIEKEEGHNRESGRNRDRKAWRG